MGPFNKIYHAQQQHKNSGTDVYNPNLFRGLYNAQQRIALRISAYLKTQYKTLFVKCNICCDTGPFLLQWDLVCDRNVLMETSQSVFTFGVMLGALSCTTLADKIGRKPIHLGCQWAMILIGVATAFSPNFIVFTVLRFLQGVAREVIQPHSVTINKMQPIFLITKII